MSEPTMSEEEKRIWSAVATILQEELAVTSRLDDRFIKRVATRVASQLGATARTVATIGVRLTEDERRHITSIKNDLEIREEAAIRHGEGPEAQTYAAERAALIKLMHIPDASAPLSDEERGTLMMRWEPVP